jgi:2-succinyl-5-enolpyruvyl-6-hydroxy-3-cyclohexene-1-carboxylate synthase
MAARAVALANGLEKGPVHLNFPFRKPLEPTSEQEDPAYEPITTPFTLMERGLLQVTEAQISHLSNVLQQYPHGLIVCGPRCPGGDFPRAVLSLSLACGYPLLADPLSGLCFGYQGVIGGYDGFLTGGQSFDMEPQVILRFGGVPTSAALTGYLSRIHPVERIYIAGHGGWADDDHRTSWYLHADPADACRRLAACSYSPADGWWSKIQALERDYWINLRQALQASSWFDGAALALVLDHLPDGTRLFVGNSLAVRNLDQFGAPSETFFDVFGNRGASGIDGNISTALGIAAADRNRPVVVLVGDITLYHDLNGLHALQRQGLENVTIFVFNNHGGGIFNRLPVAHFDPPFRELFLTPHDLKFEHAARLFSLDYSFITDAAALRSVMANPFMHCQPRLIEISTDPDQDLRVYRQLTNH